jgi:hypothetical protein
MFCDEFTHEQITERQLIHFYKDQDNQGQFEIIFSVYHNIDYDEELNDFLNQDGEIELISGEIISAERLKLDGFDFVQIKAVNSLGHEYIIFEKELA